MNRLLIALLAILASASAQAQTTPQQERMKTCNATASERSLKGDDRQDFMSKCLKGEPELTAQQEKMRTCNDAAGERSLKGDERQTFMSKCLRGSAATGR